VLSTARPFFYDRPFPAAGNQSVAMTTPLTFINSEPIDSLSSHDRGLAYGHGVFETMRLDRGSIPLRQLHLQRLALGLERLAIPLSAAAVDHQLEGLLTRMPGDGMVKLIVTAGCGPRGYRAAGGEATVIVHWYPAPRLLAGVSLQLCRYRLPDNPVLAGIKHLNRLDQVLAAAELKGDNQGLLLDRHDRVVEAISHNLFARVGGRWLTPPLDQCGVAGVMRRFVMTSLMPELGVAVDEKPLPVASLADVEELFICNAVTGLVPVTGVESLVRWPSQPGVDSLRKALFERLPCFAA